VTSLRSKWAAGPALAGRSEPDWRLEGAYLKTAQGCILKQNVTRSFIAIVPALLPVVGLKELHLSPSNLGLLYTSTGVGSVLAAVPILPWAHAHKFVDLMREVRLIHLRNGASSWQLFEDPTRLNTSSPEIGRLLC
jgi:hypothetical protein